MIRRRKKNGGQAPGAPAWMVTYSDMVTLLLTFFVLLLSMARLDKVLFKDAAGSLRGAFGVFNSSENSEIALPKIVEFAPIDDDYVARVYKRVHAHLKRLKLDESMELVKDRGAVILRMKDSLLFNSGSAVVRDEAHPVLAKIAELARPLPLGMRIEGHTDNIGDEMRNWDLSMMRAVNVLKVLAADNLFPVERLSAVGYGSRQPLDGNDTPEQRSANRRVEFVLESLNHYKKELPYLIDASDQQPF
ncbi:MAG: flagellar motor protein MotB [Deltaproteobacteria bacterium]|nr:flagellar motor protein MotB [Deltaproteobacteria bacterium]